jgi:hypothetical protein
MTTDTYPLGITNLYPCPRRKNIPIKKLIPTRIQVYVHTRAQVGTYPYPLVDSRGCSPPAPRGPNSQGAPLQAQSRNRGCVGQQPPSPSGCLALQYI